MQLGKLLTLIALLGAACLLFACGGGGGGQAKPAPQSAETQLLASVASFPLPDSGAVHGAADDPSQMLGYWISDCRTPSQTGFPATSAETMRIDSFDAATNSFKGRMLILQYSGDNCGGGAIPNYLSYDLVATAATTLAAAPGSAFSGTATVYQVSLVPSLNSDARGAINDVYTIALYDNDPRLMRTQENGGWISAASRSWLKR